MSVHWLGFLSVTINVVSLCQYIWFLYVIISICDFYITGIADCFISEMDPVEPPPVPEVKPVPEVNPVPEVKPVPEVSKIPVAEVMPCK